MSHHPHKLSASALLATTALLIASPALAQSDALSAGFTTPPAAAKPRVWWHWMNGNITKAGIQSDLEWMNRIGIGGVQNFDAAFNTPQVVPERQVYMTAPWRDDLKFSVALANSLGMEFAIASSAGWSESGGPWITPQEAMKKLVWTKTVVAGGAPIKVRLSPPPSVPGPFQNMSLGQSGAEVPPAARVNFYRDAAVIAYRTPKEEVAGAAQTPSITSSAGPINGAALSDGDLQTWVNLPYAQKGPNAWILFGYQKPQTIRGLSFVFARTGGFAGFGDEAPVSHLEASDDGKSFRKIVDLPTAGSDEQTLSFPAVTAHQFRVVFEPKQPGPGEKIGFPLVSPGVHRISELVLHQAETVVKFEAKAGYAAEADIGSASTPPADPGSVVSKSDVIDVTAMMTPDGVLQWTPPAGQWTVIRFGYSPTGHVNGPASPEGSGLEVDKLNGEHVKAYMDVYLGKIQNAVGADQMGKGGIRYMVNDSWEAGNANWTEDMVGEFRRRRGYDPRPWLPVMTGTIVESAEASDRFLWDVRKTIADLIADEHYGVISKALHDRGLGRYGESHEDGRAYIADGMEVKKSADVPMGATWAGSPDQALDYDADVRESASVAHIYGQNLVAAESFTTVGTAYNFAPETLKPTADRMMSQGLNRFVIHTSVHQPLDRPGPGIGLGPFGQWFTRNETWAEQAKPWISYLARSSYLLQQGRFVADIAYFYGEDTNLTSLFHRSAPPIPNGYNFDYINADALIHVLTVKDGVLSTPGGVSYRVLALDPNSRRMSLPVLRAIRDLVMQGGVIVGAAPSATPSLADDQTEFATIVKQLWGGEGSPHVVGAGRVFDTKSIDVALKALGVPPDFTVAQSAGSPDLKFVHRKLKDADIYFVSNRSPGRGSATVSVRDDGRTPELWHADTGLTEPVSFVRHDNRTDVPLNLDGNDAVFLVFQRQTDRTRLILPSRLPDGVAAADGPWGLSFPGLASPIVTTKLTSWTEQADPNVKYFSGTATYETAIKLPARWANDKIEIDLGKVDNIAEVELNGQPVGTVWKGPFVIDLTNFAKPGVNRLRVKVTNLWPNRLIGDKQAGAGAPKAFAVFDPFTAGSALLPSGLLGPVVLRATKAP